MHIPIFSKQVLDPPRQSDIGHHDEHSLRSTTFCFCQSIQQWLTQEISPRHWIYQPYVFLREHIWLRLLKVVRHQNRWRLNAFWTHIAHVVEETTWLATLAGATYTIEKYAPTFNFSQRTIQLRPSTNGGFLPPDEFLYPYQEQPKWTKTIYIAAIVTTVPTLIFMVLQLKIRSSYDFHAATAGTFKAIFMASFTSTVFKRVVGHYRPHFWELCRPIFDPGTKHDFFLFYVKNCSCTIEVLSDILDSFPSGHAACSSASAVFLTLYLNGKAKTFADHTAPFCIVVLTLLPLLGAGIIAAIMVAVNQHHSEDVIFGMLLGIICGAISYRSEYAAVFNYRYNHIPLPLFRSHTQIYCSSRERPDTHVLDRVARKETDKMMLWDWWRDASAGEYEKSKERDYFMCLRNNIKSPARNILPLRVHSTHRPSAELLKQNITSGASRNNTVQSSAPSISLGFSSSFSPSFGGSFTVPEGHSVAHSPILPPRVSNVRATVPSTAGSPSPPATPWATRTLGVSITNSSEQASESSVAHNIIPRHRPRSAPPEIEPVVKWATWSSHI